MHAARLLAVFVTVGIVSELAAVSALGQSNWSGSTTPQTTSNYERYAQPVNSAAAAISQQTQNAANSVGNSLRDGLDAGFRATEQSVNSAASQMSSSFSGNTSNQAVNNATRSPWPTNSAAPATQATRTAAGTPATGSGWTSIGTTVAAPPLIVPQSPMATPNYNGGAAVGTTTAAGRNGPNFPAPPVNDQQSLHSVLTDPARSTASQPGVSAPDWPQNYSGSAPATIGRTGNQPLNGGVAQDSGLVPVQGSSFGQSDPRTTTAARPNDSNWLEAWNNQSQPSAPAIESAANRAATNSNVAGPQLNGPLNNPQNGQFTNNQNAPNGQFANPAGTSPWPQSNGQLAGQPNGQMPNGQQYNNYPPGNMNPNASQMPQGQMNNGQLANNQLGMGANGNSHTQAGLSNSDQPWVPMVLAVIGLAMSFAANLYLGASYLDARQKYQSLVRKTADTFRRVSAAAA